MMKLDQKGVLHMPLAALFSLMVITGLGLWGLLHHWKTLTQTQLRLDRCTGEAALELKSKLNTIGAANQQMRALRAAEAASAAVPAIAASLKAAVAAEAIRQEAIRVDWLMRQGKWVASLGNGCGIRGDIMAPLPNLDWKREPSDGLGEQPLDMNMIPSSFHFGAIHWPRMSAAEVFSGEEEHEAGWYAHWISAQGVLRTGLP